ncbi:type I-F CRISPR-associated endonuclease Cas1 [Paraburkholderia sp. Ac-20340]|uniref:type I-F CRISPR-associated endonuclease Cas1f n=1 Tax=Paraburkholderia sp. Ac-20340 TaxID=2703888 RepID=UPI00198022AA|nr:type I-F CRISPR-associated endonuclease Cas1f [Paraburkholderia sp. Ac-20340]MBN3857923.1 type I-F CRISPR-associated endonuclease Cas1 [Paraburkholderia sp. Ac-20340]
MKPIAASDLKTILHSKRANLYYLEHCRVLVNGGRVEYVTDAGKKSLYWNIPIANTTSILLGTGTPLFTATDIDIDFVWMSPQSEYRPTEYLQAWVRFWFDDLLRLQAAKQLQTHRLQRIQQSWRARTLHEAGFAINVERLDKLIQQFTPKIASASDIGTLLTDEARLTKTLFKLAVDAVNYGDFTRAKRGSGTDLANRFLDHGNYLAYGLGATATWVLGLPHGLAVLHGKTRRGGLVFDAADLVKDSVILPHAFLSAMRGEDEQQFRRRCIEAFTRDESLDFMIDTLKAIAIGTASRIATQKASS